MITSMMLSSPGLSLETSGIGIILAPWQVLLRKSVAKLSVGVFFVLFGVLFAISYWMLGSPQPQEVTEVGTNDT